MDFRKWYQKEAGKVVWEEKKNWIANFLKGSYDPHANAFWF